MNSASERPAGSDRAGTDPAGPDVRALRALVAASPILAQPVPAPERFIRDWQAVRKSADVDALVLAWIASHVPAAHRGRMH